jgi:ribosomal protein L7/L12
MARETMTVSDCNGNVRTYFCDNFVEYIPDATSVSMRFTEGQLYGAKEVIRLVGRTENKIAGIKLIRGLSGLGLREAKYLWELAEVLIR